MNPAATDPAMFAQRRDPLQAVRLSFSDGAERTIDVAAGETLLEAAERSGIALFHQCRSGSCATCICQIVDGRIAHREASCASLLPIDVADGKRLACISEARSAGAVRFDYPFSALDREPVHTFVAKLFGIERVASDTVQLTLRAPKRIAMQFRAGQFLRLRVPGTEQWRSYSMASAPHRANEMDFLVRLIPGGAMSDWIEQQGAIGALIDAQGPFGSFFLRPTTGPHIFIAGGTGLAPFLAMIEEIRQRSGPRPPILLSFGCNHPDQLFALDRIALYCEWLPGFEARISLLDGEVDAFGARRGNPVEAITAADVAGAEVSAYLCGPPAMVEAGRAHLRRLGLADGNIFNETFVAS